MSFDSLIPLQRFIDGVRERACYYINIDGYIIRWDMFKGSKEWYAEHVVRPEDLMPNRHLGLVEALTLIADKHRPWALTELHRLSAIKYIPANALKRHQ